MGLGAWKARGLKTRNPTSRPYITRRPLAMQEYWVPMRIGYRVYPISNHSPTACHAGVLGAYAYLGPKAGREIFVLPAETADITFGGVTVITGTLGTVFGGVPPLCTPA